MHELSLCGAIYEIADRAAHGRRVGVIHLQIGMLRQVIPDTLSYCWMLVSEQTDLDGSTLDVDEVSTLIACRNCRQQSSPRDQLLLCDSCGGSDVAILSGQEFTLTALDLAEA